MEVVRKTTLVTTTAEAMHAMKAGTVTGGGFFHTDGDSANNSSTGGNNGLQHKVNNWCF